MDGYQLSGDHGGGSFSYIPTGGYNEGCLYQPILIWMAINLVVTMAGAALVTFLQVGILFVPFSLEFVNLSVLVPLGLRKLIQSAKKIPLAVCISQVVLFTLISGFNLILSRLHTNLILYISLIMIVVSFLLQSNYCLWIDVVCCLS